jgi:hypothetical protein
MIEYWDKVSDQLHFPKATPSDSIVYGMDCQGRFPGRGKIFLFSTASEPALGPKQPPIQWVLGVLSKGLKRRGDKLTTNHRPLPKSRIVKL